MALPFLELPQKKTFGSRLMEGLGLASQSIPDMIGSYQKQKSYDELGSTLNPQQKKVWDSMSPEMKEKMAPGIFTSLRKQEGDVEKDIAGSYKYLSGSMPKSVWKKYGDKIEPLYQQYRRSGMSKSEAQARAVSEATGKKLPAHLSLPEAAAQEAGSAEAASPQKQGKLIGGGPENLMFGLKSLPAALTGIGEQYATLGLLPLAQQKSTGLSLTDLLQGQKPFAEGKYFRSPSERIAEKAMEGMSPEEKEAFIENLAVQEIAGSVVAPGALKKGSKLLEKLGLKGGPKAISPDEILPPEIRQIDKKIGSHRTGEVPPSEKAAPRPKEKEAPAKAAPLEGRITKPQGTASIEKKYDLKDVKKGDKVDGRIVRESIPNTDSIESSLEDYSILPGIKEFPLSHFEEGKPKFYSSSEENRVKDLANQINNSKEINPLIVAIDQEGPYILEGAHRFDALRELGAKSFPAHVVIDESNPPIGIKNPEHKTPTEMRIERLQPEKRIYPRSEKVELREKQLKNHPKYVAEIETDAAERAARAEARVPKTVKGMDSQRIRIHEAEKKWPIAQESYNKSAGRVRALEDEVAKLKGSARESAETLLEMAKKDLDDATMNLKNAWENLEGTNYRATVQEMRDAARNKMQQIQDSISKGEEYKIHKRDYSPELIAKARQISNSKPLPKARQSDFYTKVHDVYANEYRNRLAQLEKELKDLPKTMAGLSKARELQLEKDILNKMIKSAEAEKTIQNRRFGLREMAEKHKAHERFKNLEKKAGKPEVSKVASEKMWKNRIEEAKTPGERAKVIDEAVEDIAASDPAHSEQIHAEGERLKDSWEDMFKARESKEPPSGKGKKTYFEKGRGEAKEGPKGKAKSTEEPSMPNKTTEAKTWSKKFVEHYKKKFKELKDSFPYIWNSELGRDFLVGFGTAGIDELIKIFDVDVPLHGSQIASLALGKMRGSGHRLAINALTKWVIKKIKEEHEMHSYIQS